MLTFNYYLKYFFLAITLACGFIIATNLVVDPVNVYGVVNKEGFNSIKPKVTEYRIVWKLEHTSRNPAKVYFFGDSRTEMSVNPEQEAIPLPEEYDGQVFNFAVASSSIYNVKRYLQHLLQHNTPEIISIGLEASQFSMNQVNGIDAYDKYFSADANGNFNSTAFWQRHITTLMTSDIFSASLQTITKQKEEFRKMSPYGHLYNDKSFANIFKKGTQELRFSIYEKNFAKNRSMRGKSNADFERGMVHFRDILAMTKENNIELVLIHAPTHVRLKLIQQEGGYLEQMLRWRRSLLAEIEASNARYPDAPAARYMEFDLINEKTTEAVSTNNREPMNWFIDPIHGTENYGNLMQEAVMAPRTDRNAYREVDSSMLEELEKQQKQRLQQYRQDHPGVIASLPL